MYRGLFYYCPPLFALLFLIDTWQGVPLLSPTPLTAVLGMWPMNVNKSDGAPISSRSCKSHYVLLLSFFSLPSVIRTAYPIGSCSFRLDPGINEKQGSLVQPPMTPAFSINSFSLSHGNTIIYYPEQGLFDIERYTINNYTKTTDINRESSWQIGKMRILVT